MEKIELELKHIASDDFKLGEYIYLGKGITSNDRSVVLSIGYKIDYAIKKAIQFETEEKSLHFTHISKVRVGELKTCERFIITDEIFEHYSTLLGQ